MVSHAGAACPGFAVRDFRANLFAGLEVFDGNAGFKLRAEGEADLLTLGSNLTLSGVGSLGLLLYPTEDRTGTFGVVTTVQTSNTVFELAPTARLNWQLMPKLTLHGDATLGLYFASTSITTVVQTPFASRTTEGEDSGLGILFRLAVGGFYDITDEIRLGAEVFGFNGYLGHADGTALSFLVAGSYWF